MLRCFATLAFASRLLQADAELEPALVLIALHARFINQTARNARYVEPPVDIWSFKDAIYVNSKTSLSAEHPEVIQAKGGGDTGNKLQFLTNALISAEAQDIPLVIIDSKMQENLNRIFGGNLGKEPKEFVIDRVKGRAQLNAATKNCGDPAWHSCRVDVELRRQVMQYYLSGYLPAGCGDSKYDGVVFHLRDNPFRFCHLGSEGCPAFYVQQPCEMYADVIQEGGFTSARAVGKSGNPCFDWLADYSQKSGIPIDIHIDRPLHIDACEFMGARNLVLGTSTFSQNLILMKLESSRRVYGLLPNSPEAIDDFLYYGLLEFDPTLPRGGGGYFKNMCASFDFTGYTVNPRYYTHSEENNQAMYKSSPEELGLARVNC